MSKVNFNDKQFLFDCMVPIGTIKDKKYYLLLKDYISRFNIHAEFEKVILRKHIYFKRIR